jgi:hypothetical protein
MGSAMLRRLPEYVPHLKIALPVAVALAAAILGATRGVALALLVLAAAALLLAILLLWNSIQSLDDDAELTLDEAMALAAPSAEEEKKRAVLRALKDLEYERSVGKISEEDYATLSARYRAEAKELLRALREAEEKVRERVERRVARRLEKAGLETKTQPEEEPDAEDEPTAAEPSEEPIAEAQPEDDIKTCLACDTENDTDARFCKSCGAKL